jgi:uncharacterized membrane protein YagU involved in acid resistance
MDNIYLNSLYKGIMASRKIILQKSTERGTITMSAIASTTPTVRNSLLRSIALGGIIIGIVHLIIQEWLFFSLIEKNPFLIVLQYIASAALGNAAFAGGTATALLGVLFHLIVSFVVAGVFILSANRIPLLRRYAFASSFLYGLGVLVVMNLIVMPLSAAPPLPAPTMPQLIELALEHVLVIGLTLGMLVRQNAILEK